MIELGYLYEARIGTRSATVQAISRDHGGAIHCRVYSPGTDWHGMCCRYTAAELRKLDLLKPIDGWETVTINREGKGGRHGT